MDIKSRKRNNQKESPADGSQRGFLIKILSSQGSSCPVGTILPFVGSLDKIPSGWYLCDGTNGTPNLTNRFLEGVSVNPMQFMDAGLPNITGSQDINICDGGNGAFNVSYSYQTGWGYVQGIQYQQKVTFDASRSNVIYGNSTTVQPDAYTVYFIIRLK